MNDFFDKLSSVNCWGGNVIESGFVRKDYTNRIFGYIGNKLIKVLIGQRGAGKSYLLRQIVDHLIDEGVSERNILYIDRSFTDSGIFRNSEGLENIFEEYRERIHPVGKVYLFVEEIQNIDGWQQFVFTHSQDYINSCEVFITGSNHEMLFGDTEMLLSRHLVSFKIFPFSYTEYVAKNKVENCDKSYLKYMETGALPYLSDITSGEAKWNYVSTLKNTIFFRDIVQKYRIKDPALFEDVFIFLVGHLSELISVTNLVANFNSQSKKTSYDTIATYITYLEDSFLLHRVERCQVRTKELILGSCRYYVNDWAFMGFLYPHYTRVAEAKFKNHVYLDLCRAGYSINIGVNRNRIIDFLARKDDRIIYIQCALSLTDTCVVQVLYASLESIQDNYEKWIVSLDNILLPSKEGIRHIQAWKLSELL